MLVPFLVQGIYDPVGVTEIADDSAKQRPSNAVMGDLADVGILSGISQLCRCSGVEPRGWPLRTLEPRHEEQLAECGRTNPARTRVSRYFCLKCESHIVGTATEEHGYTSL